jgi:hypothetical protein
MLSLRHLRASRLRRGIGALAAAAATTVALLGVSAGPANAAAGFTVRLAPMTNPILNVEVRGNSLHPGATVDQWVVNGGWNQVWKFQPRDSYFQIVNKLSGLCLTTDGVAGHTLYQDNCTGSRKQLWNTNLTPGDLIGYPIQSVASGLFVDVRGGSDRIGADIITWDFNGGYNQFFLATSA